MVALPSDAAALGANCAICPTYPETRKNRGLKGIHWGDVWQHHMHVGIQL